MANKSIQQLKNMAAEKITNVLRPGGVDNKVEGEILENILDILDTYASQSGSVFQGVITPASPAPSASVTGNLSYISTQTAAGTYTYPIHGNLSVTIAAGQAPAVIFVTRVNDAWDAKVLPVTVDLEHLATKEDVDKNIARIESDVYNARLSEYNVSIPFSEKDYYYTSEGEKTYNSAGYSDSTRLLDVKNSGIESVIYTGRSGQASVVAFKEDKSFLRLLLGGGDYENKKIIIPSDVYYIASSSRTSQHSSPPTKQASLIFEMVNTKDVSKSAKIAYQNTILTDWNSNKYIKAISNSRIDTGTGEETTRSGWITTDFISVTANKTVHLKSSEGLPLRNILFLYNSEKEYLGYVGSLGTSNDFEPMMLNEIEYTPSENGYIRLYLDQANDGGYTSIKNSLIVTDTNETIKEYVDKTNIKIDWAANKYVKYIENSRIDTVTGEETTRSGWVTTDFISFTANKTVYLKSSEGLSLRNILFLYDASKTYLGYIGSLGTNDGNMMLNEIEYTPSENGYMRLYLDQSTEGGYVSTKDTLIATDTFIKTDDYFERKFSAIETIKEKPIIIGKQFSVESSENRKVIDMNWSYEELIENVYDKIKELKKIELGKTVSFKGRDVYDMYAYEYIPASGIYKKTAFIDANTHGGEREAAYALARCIDIIINHSHLDERIRYIRDNVRLIIVPVANPYGHNKDVENYKNDTWEWRKYQNNARNVNMNRNWDFGWDNAVINTGYGDYVGTDRMNEETKLLWEKLIYPNLNDIDFWFDCHTGSYFAYRWWIECASEEQINPLGAKSVAFMQKLANSKTTLNKIINTTGSEAKHFAFATNVLCIPGYTLENNSLPGTNNILLNYTAESMTNYVELIMNMLYINSISDYNHRKTRSFDNVFRSKLLPAPVSKFFGDMYNDTADIIINRFESIYEKRASITKGFFSLTMPSYILDKTTNYQGDILIVGGMIFDIVTQNMYTVASPTSTREGNVSESRTMALGTKHIYSMLHLLNYISEDINPDDDILQSVLDKYKLHFIPIANSSSFINKDSGNGFLSKSINTAISDYCVNIKNKGIIFFDEISQDDRVVCIDTNIDKELENLKDCSLMERIDNFSQGTNIPELYEKLENISVVRYTSSKYSGADYTTDQCTLYSSLMINIINQL